MFGTCLSSVAVLLFVFLFSKILYRDTKCGATSMVLSFVYLILTVGVIGAGLTFLHQFVGIVSISICLLIADGILLGCAIKCKCFKNRMHSQIQVWIGLLLVVVFIVGMAVWHFGPHLKLIYIDIDSSRYFKQAMDIRRTGKISGEYLSPLILSLCIQWISPFVRAVSLYKGMILAHIGVQVISTCMFFVLAERVNKGKYARAMNVALTILYVSGFQLYILVYGTFFHWQDGTLILMFLIYHFLEIQKEEKDMVLELFSILLGFFGLVVCYPFYLIIAIVLFVPECFLWIKKYFKKLKLWMKLIFPIAAVVFVAAGAVFAGQRISDTGELIENLQAAGVIYKEPFLDFVYFLPFFVIYIVLLLKRKIVDTCKIVFRLNIMGLLFMAFWFAIYAKGMISTYYYYRCYYVIWLLAWLMTAHVIQLLIQEKQTLFLGAYAAFYAFAVITSVVGINKIFTNINEEMYLSDKQTQSMCPLYAFNIEQLVNKPAPAVSDEMFEGYNYVVTELGDPDVRMMNSYFSYMQSHWFLAVTDITHDNQFNNLWHSSVYQILQDLDEREAKYLLIQKTDASWAQYYDDILSNADVLFENTECMVVTTPKSGSWQSLIEPYVYSDNQKTQLFVYLAQNLFPKHFRVLCDSDEVDFPLNASRIFGKEDANDYIGEITADNFKDNFDRFNEDQVECVAVFKDSRIYQQNKEYFDSLYIAYENEVGMLVGPEYGVWK